MVIILCIFILIFLPSCQTLPHIDSLSWQDIPTPEAIGKVSHPVCGSADAHFIVFGGIEEGADSVLNSRLGIFDKANGAWHIMESPAEPEPRHLSSLAIYDQSIVVFGGETAQKAETADAFAFDLNRKKWERLPQTTLSPRKQASLTRVANQLVVFGGRAEHSIGDWASYDFQKKQWHVHHTAPRIESRVSHIAIALPDSKLMVWGGFIGAQRQADGFILSLDSDQIEPVPASPILSARANAKAIRLGNEVYIWGGSAADGNANTGAIFNPSTQQWRPMPAIPDKRFHELKGAEIAAWNDQGFFLIGGRFGSESFNQDLWFFDRLKEQWFNTETDQHPPGRIAHCAVALDAQHIAVFGGIGYKKDSHALTHHDGLWILGSLLPLHSPLPWRN